MRNAWRARWSSAGWRLASTCCPASGRSTTWKAKIEKDGELLLLIKTTAGAVEALKSAVAELHPYDVPELVVLAIEDGAASYLDWIGENVPAPA